MLLGKFWSPHRNLSPVEIISAVLSQIAELAS